MGKHSKGKQPMSAGEDTRCEDNDKSSVRRRAKGKRPMRPRDAEHKHGNKLSFGIELEFMFYFKVPMREREDGYHSDNSVFMDPDEDGQLPAALKCRYTNQGTQLDWAKGRVEEVIRRVPGVKIKGKPFPAGTTPEQRSMYLDPEANGWEVKGDETVDDRYIRMPHEYRSVGIEVTSPALWDSPKSYDHVSSVIRELRDRFRVRVNQNTGFHCHVGSGCEPRRTEDGNESPGCSDSDSSPELRGRKHPDHVLKRAAALMWAADGFLCHAHPPERGVNKYCSPIRRCSRLAHGLEIVNVPGRRGELIRQEELLPSNVSVSWPPGMLSGADLASNNRLLDAPAALFPAVRPEIPDEEAMRRFEVLSQSSLGASDPVNTTVESGVAHIVRCESSTQVADLFGEPVDVSHTGRCGNRFNYNLRSYLPRKFLRTKGHSGTVEFREAAGTLNPEWAAVWARICVGLFRFAGTGSDARFLGILAQLSRAEADAMAGRAHQYDMISLLYDMGLFYEGNFLARKLREDALHFWYPNRIGRKAVQEDWGNSGSERGDVDGLREWLSRQEQSSRHKPFKSDGSAAPEQNRPGIGRRAASH